MIRGERKLKREPVDLKFRAPSNWNILIQLLMMLTSFQHGTSIPVDDHLTSAGHCVLSSRGKKEKILCKTTEKGDE